MRGKLSRQAINGPVVEIPDVLKELSARLPVSRATIYEVVERSGRKGEIGRNPAVFMNQVYESVRSALAHVLMKENGLQYSQIESGIEAYWDVDLFFNSEKEVYADTLVPVRKSIHESVTCDSEIEKVFAREIDKRDDVELFVKLPDWFKIDTPVGGYNPDWAVAMTPDAEGRQDFYLIRETKGSANLEDLFRESEKWKVTFGGKHFEAINVDYKQVKSADEI
jgi:type III restriction enzyme